MLNSIFSVYATLPEKKSVPTTVLTAEIQNFSTFQAELKKTFPNFFAYFGDWGKYCVNRMFPEILDCLQLPQVKDTKVVFETGYFREIQAIANEYGATAYVAGGVVRAILGCIYQELHTAYNASPQNWGNINRFTSKEEFFGQFVSQWRDQHPTLDLMDVLGIGSDAISLWTELPLIRRVKNKIIDFMNKAEVTQELRDEKSEFKSVIFPAADVKTYADQIKRTVSQGGSALDWMAFPLKDVNGVRAIKEPREIFTPFLKGELNYISHGNSSHKKSIRGLRPLLELPFVNFTSND